MPHSEVTLGTDWGLARLAVAAGATDFDDRPARGKACRRRGLPDAAGQRVVVDVHCLPASIADQEDAVVQAVGMSNGDIGAGAFHPPLAFRSDEQVEDAIDAIRGNPAALLVRNSPGDVVGAGGLLETG